MFPTKRVQEIVEAVASEVHRRLGPESQLIWFGSWVKGEAQLTSDIDLAVTVSGGVPRSQYAQLVAWIDEELPTLYSIDLVNLDEVSDRLRREILQEGVSV